MLDKSIEKVKRLSQMTCIIWAVLCDTMKEHKKKFQPFSLTKLKFLSGSNCYLKLNNIGVEINK